MFSKCIKQGSTSDDWKSLKYETIDALRRKNPNKNEKQMANKTLDTITKYTSILEKYDPSQEEKDYVRYLYFTIAQSLVQDFGKDATKIAELISAYNN